MASSVPALGSAVRVAVVVLLAGTLAGCALGYGNTYPGAGARRRDGAMYKKVGQYGSTGVYEKVGVFSESSGGRGLGGLLATKLGTGTLALGDRDIHSDALDVGLELHLDSGLFSLGAGLSYQAVYANVDDQELTWARIPMMAYLQARLLRPFFLRGGLGYAVGGAVKLDDVEIGDSGGFMYSFGVGMAVPFPGIHFAVVLEHQRSSGSEIMLPAGAVDTSLAATVGAFWILF